MVVSKFAFEFNLCRYNEAPILVWKLLEMCKEQSPLLLPAPVTVEGLNSRQRSVPTVNKWSAAVVESLPAEDQCEAVTQMKAVMLLDLGERIDDKSQLNGALQLGACALTPVYKALFQPGNAKFNTIVPADDAVVAVDYLRKAVRTAASNAHTNAIADARETERLAAASQSRRVAVEERTAAARAAVAASERGSAEEHLAQRELLRADEDAHTATTTALPAAEQRPETRDALDVFGSGDYSSDDEVLVNINASNNASGQRLSAEMDAAEKEVDNHLGFLYSRNDKEMEVAAFWGGRVDMPHLREVARGLLGFPAASAAAENVFASAGRLVSNLRSSLSPERVNMQLMLYKNNGLWGQLGELELAEDEE